MTGAALQVYLARVRNLDEQIRREKRLTASVETPETEAETYLRRLDVGLFTLQLIDYIIVELCHCGIPSVRSRIATLLNQHGDSLCTVKQVSMMEYVDNLGEDGSKESVEQHKQKIMSLVDELR